MTQGLAVQNAVIPSGDLKTHFAAGKRRKYDRGIVCHFTRSVVSSGPGSDQLIRCLHARVEDMQRDPRAYEAGRHHATNLAQSEKANIDVGNVFIQRGLLLSGLSDSGPKI